MHSRFASRHCAPRAMVVCHVGKPWAGHGHGGCSWESPGEEMDDDFGAGFGVRRPLRFLAHRLNLDERQVAELARILDELKTERAQAEVDRRRTLSAFADALAGESFDSARAQEAGSLRTQSAERVRQAVLKALGQIHALLNAEQRLQLAYLIRTGTIAV
jgi:Spy/CpxP family protein refolding chaperone